MIKEILTFNRDNNPTKEQKTAQGDHLVFKGMTNSCTESGIQIALKKYVC